MAKPLGRLLWHTLRFYYDPLYFDRVVPVPLHPRRLRRRGFNQAYALIHEWPELALRYGLTQRSDWVDAGTLKRPRPTQPQTGLKRDRRAANLRSAFKVSHDRNIKNERILLVDDVLTTGATADACAQALLHAGAAEVCVLTLARAVL